MIMSLIKFDEKFARDVHDKLNITGITENAVFPKEKEKENYRPKTLIDETLEYIDPTPNIFTLFVQFNQKFFWNVLLPVQVKWSPRMTSCAGICSFHSRNRECIISLSTPLLKLRPRKDLIETLLHEMIHAYLFLTNDNRDRDGHGPIFQSHMRRINKEAGTNITIYHTFHDEVRLYQQHWWRCNGSCQKRAPYFGTVRRAMNRAPGPNDFWWKEHQRTCGGQFIKVKEPEQYEKGKKKIDSKMNTSKINKPTEINSILNWVNKTDSNKDNIQGKNIPKWRNKPPVTTENIKNVNNSIGIDINKRPNSQPQIIDWSNTKSNSESNFQTDLKKLGNTTNNVHGWGTGGPNNNSSTNSSKFSSNNLLNNKKPRLSFSGILGGTGTGRSILLDKFGNTSMYNNTQRNTQTNHILNQFKCDKTNSKSKSSTAASSTTTSSNNNLQTISIKTVICPSCNKSVDESKINQHLDVCLESIKEQEITTDNTCKKRKSENDYFPSKKKPKDENQTISMTIDCPFCSNKLEPHDFYDHVDKCVSIDIDKEDEDDLSIHESSSSSINLHDSPHYCLICNEKLSSEISLNDHLEECVASVFNDSNDIISDEDNMEEKSLKTEKVEILDEYPCPICMKLVKKLLMNDHLDECLNEAK